MRIHPCARNRVYAMLIFSVSHFAMLLKFTGTIRFNTAPCALRVLCPLIIHTVNKMYVCTVDCRVKMRLDIGIEVKRDRKWEIEREREREKSLSFLSLIRLNLNRLEEACHC